MNLSEEIYLKKDNDVDTSFIEDYEGVVAALKFMFPDKYKREDMRDAYISGKKIGFEMGLQRESVQGRILELQQNLQTDNDKIFYDEFLKLCVKHNIRITYHPRQGLCFEKLYDRVRT